MTAPGPAPDRAELAEAEWNCRHAIEHAQVPSLDWSLPIVLAELDHQRARIAAVLADLDKVEKGSEMFRRMHGGGLTPAIVEVPRIRALLEGEVI